MKLRAFAAASVPLSLALAFGAAHAEAGTVVLRPLDDRPLSAVTTGCVQADAPAAITSAFFRVPEIARGMHASGASLVRIELDAGGHVRNASMQRSSGNRWLDLAALDSAHLSRYRPEIRNCSATGGEYLVAVDVTEDDVR
jgi:TonB family protein